jgi:TolA-binding protein
MDCRQTDQGDIVERYLVGDLSEAEREAFERHYFACAACFDDLEIQRALQDELRRSPEAPARRRSPRLVATIRVAAALVLAVGAAIWLRPSSPTPPSRAAAPATPPSAPPPNAGSPDRVARTVAIAELARVEPPSYVPLQLRGASETTEARFRAAMRHYAAGEYSRAAAGLTEAASAGRPAPHVTFYLGISHLLSGDADRAVEWLTATSRLGESPYLEAAHFYLAKAFLAKEDVNAARRELEATVRFEGDFEKLARTLIAGLDAIPGAAR